MTRDTEKTADNGTSWIPKPRQIKLAELLLNPEDRRTQKEKFAALRVPERTGRRWLKDKRYIDYLNSQIELLTDGKLVEVWIALINQCRRGNTMAIRLFFELKGMYKFW